MLSGIRSEMRSLPALRSSDLQAGSLGVSLLIPARGAADSLEATVLEAHRFLSRAFAGSFEIILIPNPPAHPKVGAAPDHSIEVAQDLAKRYSNVRVTVHQLPAGKGAALRTGFLAARGNWIFFTDADLPYDLSFFESAAEQLTAGFDLVTGNRRIESSVFNVPVSLLRIAYSRHRLGLGFNRVVRCFMPIQTTDTQAGIKAMSRRMAEAGFQRQRCPGFFFDLEFFLTCSAFGFAHVELPVTLYLNTEKSTVRVLRESVLAGFWLTRITGRNLKKAYGPLSGEVQGVCMVQSEKVKPLARYRGTPPSTRLFLEARWRLTPYSVMASKLPPQGTILDLGCGHGLFSLALALSAPGRKVVGLDHDVARIELARSAGLGVANLSFAQNTLSDFSSLSGEIKGVSAGQVAGVSLIDVMHYFPYEEQERLFRQAHSLLSPGGTLIVREVNPNEGLTSKWNRLYEKLATSSGFTRSEKKTELHFRTREGWTKALEAAGFEVTSERCSSVLFADILYVCRKSLKVGGQA